jgi:hypothetical protein
MRQGRIRGSGRLGAVAAALALVAALAACNRDPPRMTACEGNRPAVARTIDVAPPTCDPVLPGTPQPAAEVPTPASGA